MKRIKEIFASLLLAIKEFFNTDSEPEKSPPMPNKIRISDLDQTLIDFITQNAGGVPGGKYENVSTSIVIDPGDGTEQDPGNKAQYNGATVFAVNNNDISVTLNEGLGDDFIIAVVKRGSANVNFIAGTNVTVLNGASLLTRTDGIAILWANTANNFHYMGDLETNQKPTISFFITGTIAPGNILGAEITYLDAEGDAQGIHKYRWFVMDKDGFGNVIGGTDVTVGNAANYTVQSSDLNKKIFLTITPYAATGNKVGDPVTSSGFDVEGERNFVPKDDSRVKFHVRAGAGKLFNDVDGNVLAASGQTVRRVVDEVSGKVMFIDSPDSPSAISVNGKMRIKLNNTDYLPVVDPAFLDDLINAKTTGVKWAFWALVDVKSIVENAILFKHDYSTTSGGILYINNRKKAVLGRTEPTAFTVQTNDDVVPGIYNAIWHVDLSQGSVGNVVRFYERGGDPEDNNAANNPQGSGISIGNNVPFSMGRPNGQIDIEVMEWAIIEGGDIDLFNKLEGYGAHENNVPSYLAPGHPYIAEPPKVNVSA